MVEGRLTVVGRVLSTNLHGIAGLRVEVHRGVNKLSAVTDQKGGFVVTFDASHHPSLFKSGKKAHVNFTFQIFAGETLLKTAREAVPRYPEGGKFEIDIVLSPRADSLVTPGFSIAGRVVDRNRPPRSFFQLDVEAWHKEEFLEKLIGRSPTDPKGAFSISATREYLERLSIPARPNVVLRVNSEGRQINGGEEPFFERLESGRKDIVIEVGIPVPQVLDEPALVSHLGPRLAGPRADGVRPDEPPEAAPDRVVWVDAGDEVLVHLDSLKARVLERTILVALDLETDQTGRSTLVCAFALGGDKDPAGLLAVTEELPQGHPLLAARWGRAVQAAIWNGLLELAGEQARSRNAAPLSISIAQGKLKLGAGAALFVRPGQ